MFLKYVSGILKYQAEHGNDAERKDEAKKAHAMYKTLADPQERRSFLQEFEDQGNGKTAGSLKFHTKFCKTVTSNKTTEVGASEGIFTLAKILEFEGMRVDYFANTQEAYAAAMSLVEDNKKLYGHDGPWEPNDKFPIMSKHYFIHQEGGVTGKRRVWKQDEEKKLTGDADVKTKKQLQDSELFIEGIGKSTKSEADSPSKVKVESAAHEFMKRVLEDAEKMHKKITTMIPVLQDLNARMSVKASKDAKYADFAGELAKMCVSFENFASTSAVTLFTAEDMAPDEADEQVYKDMTTKLQAFLSNAEHHLGGMQFRVRNKSLVRINSKSQSIEFGFEYKRDFVLFESELDRLRFRINPSLRISACSVQVQGHSWDDS